MSYVGRLSTCMKYLTFMTSRDVNLQGTVHDINANIYDSKVQTLINCVKYRQVNESKKSNTLCIQTYNIHNTG